MCKGIVKQHCSTVSHIEAPHGTSVNQKGPSHSTWEYTWPKQPRNVHRTTGMHTLALHAAMIIQAHNSHHKTTTHSSTYTQERGGSWPFGDQAPNLCQQATALDGTRHALCTQPTNTELCTQGLIKGDCLCTIALQLC